MGRKIDNYRKILITTTRLMSERGYYGTSVQMIADEVGITKSTIFHHFKNKEAILLAILEEHVPPALHQLMLIASDDSLSGVEKLKEFVTFQLRLVAEKGDVFNVYLSESKHLASHNKKVYKESRRAYTDLVRKIVTQIQKEEHTLFSHLTPTIVAMAILGMCNWSPTWYRRKGKLDIDVIADQFYQILMSGSR